MEKDFKSLLLEKALQQGFSDAEIYYVSSKASSVTINKSEISKYQNSELIGLSFRGTYNGNMGYSSSEILNEETIPIILEEAKQNAEIMEEKEQDELFAGSESYSEVKGYNTELENVSVTAQIENALLMEKSAFAVSTKIVGVDYCEDGITSSTVEIKNTKGLDVSFKSNGGYAYTYSRALENGNATSGIEYWVGNDWSKFDAKNIGVEASMEALRMVGAKSIKSGSYKVIMRNTAMADFLGACAEIFLADNVQKGLSLLNDEKLNTVIASPLLTLRDDALLEGGLCSTPFDAEGVATSNKAVIENGVLKTLLHNSKTAKKSGVASTGNANKPSYKSPVIVEPTNFYITAGEKSLDELIEFANVGMVITAVEGLHAGLNPISGDFSLLAQGFYFNNGQIERPVEQITIAGNFYSLIKDITAIGSDLRFGFPSSCCVGSPSILIENIDISGE